MASPQHQDFKMHTFWGDFIDPKIERDFRQDNFLSEKKSFLRFFVLCLAAVSIFTVVGFFTQSLGNHGNTIQLIRFIVILMMIGCAFGISKITSIETFQFFTLSVITIVSLITLSIPLLRPPEYSAHYISDVVLIYSYYILFPISLRFQIFPAIVVTSVELIVLVTYKSFEDPFISFNLVVALSLVNLAGFLASRHNHIRSRERFQKLKEEEAMHAELRTANEKVELLEGLIPICASCKSIRNDEGYWEVLEQFLLRHGDITFTHGICPNCVEIYDEPEPIAEI